MPHLITPKIEALRQEAEASVMEYFKVSRAVIYSPAREEASVRARFVVWYILKRRHKLSYTLIAELYQKDHTTIISGVRTAERLGLVDWVPKK